MVVSPATRVVKVFSKGVGGGFQSGGARAPKVKVVVGDTGVVEASKLEGTEDQVKLLQQGLEQLGLAWPVPNSCKYVCS